MITLIKFGTSGWRAKIAEHYTVANLRKIAVATALHIKNNRKYGYGGEEYEFFLKSKGRNKPPFPLVVVGYDTRFFSEIAARIVSEVFAYHGIHVVFSNIESPTPVVGWMVIELGAVGGVVITASHNPPEYNGFKWTPFWGGPASVEITRDIEEKIFSITDLQAEKYIDFETAINNGIIKVVDFHENYFNQIKKIIDFKIIKTFKGSVVTDSIFGCARSYLRKIVESAGIKVKGIREERDVYFGGKAPDTDEENLSALKEIVVKEKHSLGIACDGDADRFGIITSNGKWLSPNIVLALCYYHLINNKKLKGGVVRSVMTTHMVDVIAKENGFDVRETPVGFKYIGELLRTGEYVIGGEESGGLSVRGHVPEKDGILACLLILELMAYERKELEKIIENLEKRYGKFYNMRINFKISDSTDITQIIAKLEKNPPLKIASKSVWRIDTTDGFKFILKDGDWLGLRPSGTEPVVRIYAESRSNDFLMKIIEEGKKIFNV
ncbi:MAG: hypothetical protein N2446_00165 [Elusimicrobiales bacterium]|nr:hypothetical protein [Elusimicrobiales bacterium]